MKTSKDILEQLDSCASIFQFPVLDNGYAYLAGTNLTAFCDTNRWAIIIETICFNYRAGGHNGIVNCLYIFGNCLQFSPGMQNSNFLYLTDNFENVNTFDDDELFYLNPESSNFLLRNVKTPISHNRQEYSFNGISLENADKIKAFEFLRLLDKKYHEKLVATEDEIRMRIPSDIPQILKMRDWFHPDISSGEIPSENETFKLIATVLETERQDLFKPTKESNTFWGNWPESGTL